ncbi:Dehydrosqualene synthase [Legionella massiliensis]|uniref:Dehydrosqualene synthase n=1 Tax=Legionella massiliensis TaxID=1034943 RepID=A0A078KXG7_9GAMM|nr:squalene/phytoene synthase family protein [Legionella massiliensis]CDZ77737.1 Dehydrosqualene synthase [Legionella massiliensis]CEE13475.1 Dehydrosqualene synthase [Legionella massiliensis]
MQPYIFYEQHLSKVSRSFTFCIRELPEPAKEWVALSYLLCRIIDTIEDSTWPNKETQFAAFQQMKSFLTESPSKEQFSSWLNSFPVNLVEAERKLLLDLPILLDDKNELPNPIKTALTNTTSQMVDGMAHFLTEYKTESNLSLPSLTAANQYCFFVAGIVGELLSHIFTYLIPTFEWTEGLLNQALHFGLFLQKINLLKDKGEDEAAGRFYIASREQLRQSLILNAQQALAFIQAIPVIPGRKYRLACAWPLFIGLASLKWIDKNWQRQTNYKITPRETKLLIQQTAQLIDDNHALETLFKRYLTEEAITPIPREIHSLPAWFETIYPKSSANINYLALGLL